MTTNLLPQDTKQNSGVWRSQEELLQTKAQDEGYKFFVYAGGYGQGGGTVDFAPLPNKIVEKIDGETRETTSPINIGDFDPNQFAEFNAEIDPTETVTVPTALWKVVLGFSPTNTTNTPDIHFAWWIPNNSYSIKDEINYAGAVYNEGEEKWIVPFTNRGRENRDFQLSIKQLETRLNDELPEDAEQFNFLRNLPKAERRNIRNNIRFFT